MKPGRLDPPPSRNLGGCLVASLIAVGVVLMLPASAPSSSPGYPGSDGGWLGIILFTFVIAGGGVWRTAWAPGTVGPIKWCAGARHAEEIRRTNDCLSAFRTYIAPQ